MADNALFTRLCKQAAKDVAAGRLENEGRPVVDFLDQYPEAILPLVDLLVHEGRKKRPSEKLLTAYAWMLTYGLEFIRYRVDRNLAIGTQLADEVRRHILQLAAEQPFDPGLLMILLGQFKQAKLEIGDELRQLMLLATEDASHDPAHAGEQSSIADHWAEVAALAEGDSFALHGHLADQAGVFPPEHRAAMALSMLDTDEEVVREAALGWLLDADAVVRTTTAGGLEQAAKSGRVNGTMLRRMIAVRNWLPEADRAPLDRAIKLCRQREIVCVPWPVAKLDAVIASGLDGSAAQSLFVVTKEGRKFAVASLLVKHDAGVRDAFTLKKLSRADVTAFLDEAADNIDLYPVSHDHLAATIRHFLAVTGRAKALPPFGLLDVAETVGVSDLNPQYRELEPLIAFLCEQIDASDLDARGVSRLIKRSARWSESYPFIDSWFEANGAIDALLTADPPPTGEPTDIVLHNYLPQRRRYWAEIFAWSALVLRQAGSGTGWEEFTVVARELLAGRDLTSIPIMTMIASVSADVYQEGLGDDD